MSEARVSMAIHPEELAFARAYAKATPFEGLTDEQLRLIMDRGRSLYKWYKGHFYIHSLINLLLIVSIFTADFFILIRLPRLFLDPQRTDSFGTILLASLVTGCFHSWLMYSLDVFSLHEGAAHRMIFPASDPVSKVLQTMGANLCRIAGAEPEYYAKCHMGHHAKFGTEEDAEFLNFVSPRRYLMTFFPLAAFLNFSDFIIHRPLNYTRGRLISAIFSVSYNSGYAYALYRLFGLPFMALTMLVIVPHFGFYLDRVRQFTEHNLMPLENRNGARSFGIGFWGMLVGGGPWGQPCHWAHHLVASIPWYQQIALHKYITGLLTPQQRKQFLIEPVIGFPRLWWRILRESGRAMRPKGA